jgi:ABC-type lipoprotein release transport system permease subunit
MKDFQIAWRNLWRNRKRTMITIAAVVMAVILSAFMSSMQEGTYAKMIDNIVKFYSGYLQIHQPDYWELKSINESYEPSPALYKSITSCKEITLAVPRLESFTLISSGENTRGCALIGIDPVREDSLTGLSKWIVQGKFLTPGDGGILLAFNLAKNLDAQVGDTLILISQGYHGASASALMPIRGILKFPSPQLNSFGAYLDIGRAGDFFGAPGKVTSIAILVNDFHQVKKAQHDLRMKLGNAYSVKTWDEMQPDLVKMIEGDRAGAIIMKGILYLLVGFGILGTIIMMMSERKRELGVMVAIGMQKFRLQRMLCYESLCIGLFGVVIGILVSIPVIQLLVHNPVPLQGNMAKAYEAFGIEAVIYFSTIPKVFINQAITVFVITLLITIYPMLNIWRMNVIKSLRG